MRKISLRKLNTKQVNIITKNLKINKVSFSAGSISIYLQNWEEILHKWILQTVPGGAFIDLKDLVKFQVRTYHKTRRLYSGSEKIQFRKEISKLLQKDFIKLVSSLEKGYVSSIFVRGKKDKRHRLILNLINLHQSVVSVTSKWKF